MHSVVSPPETGAPTVTLFFAIVLMSTRSCLNTSIGEGVSPTMVHDESLARK